ncbi:MAG: glycosyltransferase family 2 protein [Clostridia bacterium]|nr:glycosyltransferase family 2 protein [Clostridia bacterium]
MFFSIIIPVYNAEISLNRCLYSVLSQTFDDFEVIVIDDGSQDKSHEIYKAFAKQDARVSIYTKKTKEYLRLETEGWKQLREIIFVL